MNAKVSIILVNYNGNDDTIACLNSLTKIEYDNAVIIVVDNASKNVSELEKKINESYLNTILVKSNKNIGFSGGNNLGIEYAKKINSDYVLLLNNDTEVDSRFVIELISEAKMNNKVGIVTGKIFFYNDKQLIWFAGGTANLEMGDIKHLGSCKNTNEYLDDRKEITFATGCLMLIPMKVIRNIGLLNEQYFLYSEDLDYCCRVIEAGYKIYYTPKAIIYHKVSSSTGGRRSLTSQYYITRNNLFVLKRYLPKKMRKKGYIYLILRALKGIFMNSLSLKYTILGYIDFVKGIEGMKKF